MMNGTEALAVAKTSQKLYESIIFLTTRAVDKTHLKIADSARNSARLAFVDREVSSQPEENIKSGINHLTLAYAAYQKQLQEKSKQAWFSKALSDEEQIMILREIVLTGAFIALSFRDLGNNGSFNKWRERVEEQFHRYQSVTDKLAMEKTFFMETGQGWQSRWSFYKGTFSRIKKECNRLRVAVNERLDISINGTTFNPPPEKNGIAVEVFSQDMPALYLEKPYLNA